MFELRTDNTLRLSPPTHVNYLRYVSASQTKNKELKSGRFHKMKKGTPLAGCPNGFSLPDGYYSAGVSAGASVAGAASFLPRPRRVVLALGAFLASLV